MNLTNFKDGICIFAFDLSLDEDDGGDHWDLVKEGETTINIHFSAATVAAIEVIIYAEFDNLLTIDHARNTFIDTKA